jgi:hypothetical protein
MNPYEILDINENSLFDDVKQTFYKKSSSVYYSDKKELIKLINAWKYYKSHIFGSNKLKEELINNFENYYNEDIEIPSIYELVEDNAFDIFGITMDTPLKEAKKKYYELALLTHPDKGGRKEDMTVLHGMWKYIEMYLNTNLNRTVDLEFLDKEFKDFCKKQEEEELPAFSKLFEENPFTEIFNKEFETTYEKPLFEQGGYGYLYDEPDDLPSLCNVNKEIVFSGNYKYNLINSEIPDNYSEKDCYDYYLAYLSNKLDTSNILKNKQNNDMIIYDRMNGIDELEYFQNKLKLK